GAPFPTRRSSDLDGTRRVDRKRGSGRGEPRCDRPEGPSESRFHRGKPDAPSTGRLFFNAGPFLFDPALDFPLVALHRPALRFLGTPVQSAQQTPDSGDLVMNAKARPNQLGNAGTGPQVGRKAGRLSPLQ